MSKEKIQFTCETEANFDLRTVTHPWIDGGLQDTRAAKEMN